MIIFKYPLNIEATQILYIPGRFKVLSFQLQGYIPTLWVLADKEYSSVAVQFEMYGTGQEVNYTDETNYCGTIQQDGFVWHLFYR